MAAVSSMVVTKVAPVAFEASHMNVSFCSKLILDRMSSEEDPDRAYADGVRLAGDVRYEYNSEWM